MGRDTGDLLQGTLGMLILKALAAETHQWGGRIYTDLLLNHNGFANRFCSASPT